MYLWTGQPWKTATVVRAAETLFTNGPDGMTGNDDLGTMSAWYVFSRSASIPTMSGANFFVVSTPQFPHAELQLGAFGTRQGGTLTIDAPGTSAAGATSPRRASTAGRSAARGSPAPRSRTAGAVAAFGAADALGHGGAGGAALGRQRALIPTRSPSSAHVATMRAA